MAQPSESEMGARYMTFQELLKDEREKNAADKNCLRHFFLDTFHFFGYNNIKY